MQFRMDNTEGYSADELALLNEAFEAVIAAEEKLAGDPDVDSDPMPGRAAAELSDYRQHIGEQIEAAWMPGRSAAEVVAHFYTARERYRDFLRSRGEL